MLWRHGRTAWNGENRFQGHLDIPLDEVGRAQAARGAALLAGLGPHALASSDLQRARDTAAELARVTGLEIAVDRGLRETAGGRWEGLLATDIAATDAEAYAAWRSGSDVAAGGAETRSQVADRATAAVRRLLESVADGSGRPRRLTTIAKGWRVCYSPAPMVRGYDERDQVLKLHGGG